MLSSLSPRGWWAVMILCCRWSALSCALGHTGGALYSPAGCCCFLPARCGLGCQCLLFQCRVSFLGVPAHRQNLLFCGEVPAGQLDRLLGKDFSLQGGETLRAPQVLVGGASDQHSQQEEQAAPLKPLGPQAPPLLGPQPEQFSHAARSLAASHSVQGKVEIALGLSLEMSEDSSMKPS